MHADSGTFDRDRRKEAGKMLIVKRTEGVSTTDLVNRMLRVASARKSTAGEATANGDDAKQQQQHSQHLEQAIKISTEQLQTDA